MIKKIYIIFFSLLFIFITQNNHGLEYYANKQDELSSNTDVEKAALENIKSAFKTLCDFCKKDFNTEYSNDLSILKEEFDNINKNSKVFDRKELVDPIINGTKNPKYCACVPKSASATKGHIYNAAKIPVEGGYCVISQGPYNKTFENFFALLGENGANISISNVCNDEFINKSTINNRLRELIANKESPLVIKAIKDDISDNYLRDQYEVVMLDYYVDSDAELEYEVFSINGKLHLRIYNTDWEDDYSGNIHKVLAIAIFIEKLNKLDIFEQPDAPIVYTQM